MSVTKLNISDNVATILASVSSDPLTQADLNTVTDAIAAYVDTVNPDREYPKKVIL